MAFELRYKQTNGMEIVMLFMDHFDHNTHVHLDG